MIRNVNWSIARICIYSNYVAQLRKNVELMKKGKENYKHKKLNLLNLWLH